MTQINQTDFKAIFESAPGLYLILLPDLTISAVNDAYLEATMTSRLNIIGQHMFKIFPDNPDDSSATGVFNLRSSLEYVLKHKVAHTMAIQKYDIRCPKGEFEERYWSPVNKPVLNSAGEVEYIIHRVEDVTDFISAKVGQEASASAFHRRIQEMEMEIYKRSQEIQDINQKLLSEIELRKKAEEDLKKTNGRLDQKLFERTSEMLRSKNELSETFERITDAFVVLNKNWCYTYLNSRGDQMFNKPQGYLIGKNIWDEFPEEIGTPFYNDCLEAMKIQQYVCSEAHCNIRNLWFEVHIYPSPGSVSVFFCDITAKKKATEVQLQNQSFVESILNASQDSIYVYDIEEKKNIYANEGLQLMLGYTADEIKEMDEQVLPALMHQDDFKIYLENTYPKYAGLADREVVEHEFRMKHKNGEWRWLYCKESVLQRKSDGTAKQIYGITSDITGRRKAVDEVVKPYNEMDNSLNRITDSIISLDREWRYTFMNDAALATHPMGRENAIGKTIWEVHPELSKTFFGQKFIEVMHTQVAGEFENYYPPMNIWVNVKAFPSSNGLTLYYEDVTYRKTAEEKIKVSEEKYRTLVEEASDAIFIIDTSGKFITVNSSACKLSQCSEAELLKMSIHDFTVLEDIQKNPFHFEELKQGIAVRTERVMKSRDGIFRHIEINAKQLSDGRLLAFVRDISERIKAQNEIIEEKKLSDSIINSLPCVFYLYDKEGKFLRWNKNFEKVSQYSSEEMSKMHPLDFFDEDEKQLVAEKIGNVFVNGEDNVQANFLLKNKEKIPYYFTGVLVDYNGGECLMGVGIDFSELSKANDKIKEGSHQLRRLATHLQTIREQERKRIGREIHDELGQQLTAIKMDVVWIDKKISENESDIKSKVNNIITLLDGSDESIRKILNELRHGILEDNGLLEALEWQGNQFTEITGIPIKFITRETAIEVQEQIADCIFRVYQEALTNIMRHAGASKVLSSLILDDDSIILTVEDDGKGFDSQTSGKTRSFGLLGMQERVHSLNGRFMVNSDKDNGTKIYVALPRLLEVTI
jgi:PAS domain S-box-containing protein